MITILRLIGVFYGILKNALSAALYPTKGMPWMGVDGWSGNLVSWKISSDSVVFTVDFDFPVSGDR